MQFDARLNWQSILTVGDRLFVGNPPNDRMADS
jgi:hypothetical protein